MKNNSQPNTIKRLFMWAICVAAILLIPLIAKFPWTMGDFVFAGVVLFGAATIYEFATKNIKNKSHRIFVGIALIFVIILIWAWAVA